MSLRPATQPISPPAPDVTGEQLRLAMQSGRFTWIGNLGLALLVVMIAWDGPQALVGVVWWVVLGLVLLSRGAFCARRVGRPGALTDTDQRNYALFAATEGLLWAVGLIFVEATTRAGAVLQFGLAIAAVVGSLLAYGALPRVWLAMMVPVAFAQLVILLTHRLPVELPLAFAWAICLGMALFASAQLSRGIADNLRLRLRAEEAVRDKDQAFTELSHGRDRLRLALEAIDAGIADTNVVTGERFFSARYAQILGYADLTQFMEGHRFSEALHEDDRARVLESRRRHIEEGAPFREEFRLRTARGDYIWVDAHGESARDADGRATRFVMSVVDITARRESERRLVASERRYRALVEASPSLIWMCDRAGRLTFVSARGSRGLYGYEPRQMIGKHVTAFSAPEFSRREFLRRFLPVFHGLPVFDIEATHRTRTGGTLYVTVSAMPTLDADGKVDSVLGTCTDITALKGRERELHAALRNQQLIFDAAGEGIVFARDGVIESTNGALAEMLGVAREWLIGRPVREILARPAEWDEIRRATDAAGKRGEAASHEVVLRAPGADGGTSVWCQLTSRVAGDEADADAAAKMIVVLTDITALKRREELAWHQANHDELTGLPNRRLLVENARRLLSVAMRRKRLAALMVLDLDGFKEVNDVFGHAHGDALLRQIALRLSTVLREYDLVARTGGDEFVVVLPEIDAVEVVNHVAEKLIAAAAENLESPERTVRVRASIGVALFPSDGQDFDSLLASADAAMYAAKAAGKNRYCFAVPPAPAPAAGVLQ